MQNPFAEDGPWLRCALHAHTTNSDGELAPSLLVRHYERAGFDVLALTDHWVRTVEPSTDRLLVLLGTELDASMGVPGREAHVLGLGVEAEPVKPGAEFPGLNETVAWIEEAGGLPYLAHPYWSGLHAEEFAGCEGLLGLEVYNAGCELEVGRGLAGVHWDDVLEADGRPWFGIAVDDSHHPGTDSGLAWTWVRSAGRSADAVLAALREGSFYSSNGPEIQTVEVTDGVVEVRTSPVESVRLLTGRTRGAAVNTGQSCYASRGEILERSGDGAITAARLQAPKQAPYARLEVTDGNGNRAWTNPLWV
jgi:predicted metal-dependent phosphoesterase TrpH